MFFKITFKDEGTTDSMVFEAPNEKDAWTQLDALTGGVPRNSCTIKSIKEAEYREEAGLGE